MLLIPSPFDIGSLILQFENIFPATDNSLHFVVIGFSKIKKLTIRETAKNFAVKQLSGKCVGLQT